MSRTPTIPSPYAERLATIRAAFSKANIDALLIQNRRDQYYLTGFSGEDGYVLITPRQVVLLTDSRFDETADLEAPFAKKVLRKRRSATETAKLIRRHKLSTVGYDPRIMSVFDFTTLKKEVDGVKLKPVSGLCEKMRLIKSESELDTIREAVRVAEQAFKATLKFIKPGRSEAEIAAKLVYEMQRRGASGPGFAPIVAAGENSSLPHYEPGDRKINANEGLLIDWGAQVDWYTSDLTRMVWIGRIPPRIKKVCGIVREALAAGIAAVQPGELGSSADTAARNVIKKAGFGKQFGHSLGHGIGLQVHEGPRLAKTSEDVLTPGMVVTVEPGIYLPGVGGVRLEEDVLVTESGHSVLSTLPLEHEIMV